ncbi:MAG: amidohydrolase family protein [Rhodobacteraceae bacterium]|jgi:imidazolonepropionase-like amidohydrolase|nr:amidohydrolase family protein [Paracoccaceae bacterium]MBL4558382.1 amidohydrolase family protein [Paracoccaceae bacterium]
MFQDPIWQEKNRQVAEGAPQAMPLAKQYGVKILWRTDVFFGDDAFQNFRREFVYRDDVFTPSGQVQQVTGNYGEIPKLSGWKDPHGVIAERAYADLLLIDGDPTQDIRLLMDAGNIDLTMKNGVNYKDTL